ncbi:MAG: catabolite gene activator [Rhodomicrobium sp.]|nr:MAG: catabolite gene activator [Rhodomicrobium sp.]
MARSLKIPLFAEVSDHYRQMIERSMIERIYHEDELILDYDDQSTDVLFILSGKVRVLYRSPMGREVILADLGADDFFGELSAIDNAGRSANVTALQRSEIISLPRAQFMEVATAVPAVAEQLLTTLVGRIRALDQRFSEMSVMKTNERLYAELLRLSQPRRGAAAERIISPPPFHHHLAGRIGCRREVVSRELSQLMKEGIIVKTKGGLVLADVELLKERVAAALD